MPEDTVPIYPDQEFQITPSQLFSPPLPQSLISRLWEVGPQLLYTNRPCPALPIVAHQLSKSKLPLGKQRKGAPDWKPRWKEVT